jgi:hypothetical protein
VGDADNDGYEDVLTGAYGYNPGSASQSGIVYVNHGPFDGTESLAAPDATIVGAAQADSLGWSVSSGDFDGDGANDIVAGAYGYDVGTGTEEGAAYVFAGPIAGDLTTADALFVVIGSSEDAWAGRAVSTIEGASGTLAVVGAPYDSTSADSAGAVAIFSAGSGELDFTDDADATFWGDGDDALAGSSVASGDVNADGIGDLIVGAPGTSGYGTVCIALGPLSGSNSLDSVDTVILGISAGDGLGSAVASGDLDGDGVDDVLMGADYSDSGASDAGSAYVFTSFPSGTTTAATANVTVNGANAQDYVGRSIAVVGDVDADGYNEFSVGATAFDASGGAGAGAAFLLYGPSSGTISLASPEAVLQGANAYDAMGHRTAGADLDGDGYSDVLATAMGRDDNGTSSGGVFGWFGSVE